MPFQQDGYQVTRHVCPRNCYDACGILAFVKNGRLEKVAGDPAHGYTKGKLCAKGYSYINRVYHPDRLKYPLRQVGGRGSGKWERITWDEALGRISEQITGILRQKKSALPLCLNKYSGNFGILHYAADGLFNSFGQTTQAVGSPCWSAGLDAQYLDMGDNRVSVSQDMEKARVILLWGVNPAWTSIHSMPYLYRARERGATIVVIDPIYTQTAKKADIYFQIKAGSDGALALALAALIRRLGKADISFLQRFVLGWEQFAEYLSQLDIARLVLDCGQSLEAVEELSRILADNRPVFIWAGFGLQRHSNGGQNLRAIDALAAITGSIGTAGGGVQYAQLETWKFSWSILQRRTDNRLISINNFARQLQMIRECPVQFVWFSCRNAVAQDASSNMLLKQLKSLDMVVTVDQFLTPTAQSSDIVLPCTTQFEELDMVVSYWHHWLAINEAAIAPRFEAKSELDIAKELAVRVNALLPGSSSFPSSKTNEAFLDDEFTEEMKQLFGITHWSDLLDGPKQALLPASAWQERNFATPSGKYELISTVARDNQLPQMAVYSPGSKEVVYPLRLLSPHFQHGINSQFINLDWLGCSSNPTTVFLHALTAARKDIVSGQMIRIFNANGELIARAELSPEVPIDIVLIYHNWTQKNNACINALVDGKLTDMGELRTGAKGMAFYDVFVDIETIV